MDTLLGFMTFTKGVEYLLAIGYLIAFVAFWLLVYGKGRGTAIKVAALSYMVIGIILVMASCVTTPPQ